MSDASQPQANTPIVQVALPVPLRQVFDYLPPSSGDPTLPGGRVVVPFGRRRLVGIVVGHAAQSAVPESRLLPIQRVLDQGQALFDEKLMSLLSWCWRYYKHAPGEVLRTALPPALRTASGSLPDEPRQFRLTDAGRQRLEQGPGRAPQQYAALQSATEGPVSESQLMGLGSRWRAVTARLLEQGWLLSEPLQPPTPTIGDGLQLLPEQEHAVTAMRKSTSAFAAHLLDGITGSGKTEVYLQLLAQVIREGGQALVLVPEIGLTPQLLRRFEQRLGLAPEVLHSGIAAGERLQAWQAARTGRAKLVVGTRSALFVPMPDLRLVILDEEHDLSFKQQDGFRYSARDVAVKRAADAGVPVILGSATPSLESLHNALCGRYQHHRLRERANQARLPDWRVLDLRQQPVQNGLAAASLQALDETLQSGEQAMVFLNRRGYAPVLLCGQCGWHGRCDRCDAHLTWHRSAGSLRCHHCGHERRLPQFCPQCRADALRGMGEGTQQLESALKSRFPGFPVVRIDRDSTRRKGSLEDQLESVQSGQPCILVGTQMLAKGHHFPGITRVVVANLDQALYSIDYRALERLGQTLLQVAGRAGRGQQAGEVILQTHQPESPALQCLIRDGYEVFARQQLSERKAAGLPPFRYQAVLRAEHSEREPLQEFLNAARAGFPAGGSRVYGPIPALLERLGGRYRMYLLAEAEQRSVLHADLDQWLESIAGLRAASRVRWSLDVDPQEL